jgi:hypothetical protein
MYERCTHCKKEYARFTLPEGQRVCSRECGKGVIAGIVAGLDEEAAKKRLLYYFDRVSVKQGKRGALLQEEADEVELLAQRLNVKLEWYNYNTDTWEWGTGRKDAK